MVKCPICDACLEGNHLNARALDVLKSTHYEYAHCLCCDAMVLIEPIKKDEPVDYSSSGYYSKKDNKAKHIIQKLMSLFSQLRVNAVKKWIDGNSIAGLEILDIGCGKGGFLVNAKNEGAIVHGVEPTKRSFEVASAKLGDRITNQMMSKEIFPEGSIDVVTMWHVFEHISEPLKILDECHYVLKPGGCLIIAVPNYRGWIAKFGGALWFNLDPPRHLIHYSEKALRRVVESSGFMFVGVSHHYAELTYFSVLQTLLNKLPITGNFLFNFLKRNKSAFPENRVTYIKDSLLTVVAGVILFPFVVVGTITASIIKNSDCITIVARKK